MLQFGFITVILPTVIAPGIKILALVVNLHNAASVTSREKLPEGIL